jgi:hypothetical protein
MQIPSGKIYGLLLGMALRMRKGAEHAVTPVVASAGECAFSANGWAKVRLNFGRRIHLPVNQKHRHPGARRDP